VLPARYAGVRAVRCGPLSGNPCGGQKYLVVASNRSSAPRELEVGAARLQEDARRSSRSFVPVLPSSVSALPLEFPKSPKLTEVCVPTPQTLCCAPPSSLFAWCLAAIHNTRSERLTARAQALRMLSQPPPHAHSSFRILWAIWRQKRTNQSKSHRPHNLAPQFLKLIIGLFLKATPQKSANVTSLAWISGQSGSKVGNLSKFVNLRGVYGVYGCIVP
jgi:hypothetical protein